MHVPAFSYCFHISYINAGGRAWQTLLACGLYVGYTRKVVDPMVRLAYNVREFRTVREQAPGSRKDAGNFLATRSSAHHATLPMVPQGATSRQIRILLFPLLCERCI